MSYNIVVTSAFRKQAKQISKRHRSLKDDLALLISSLETCPVQGESLGKDCYKIRMLITSKGKGKSGGARIITCVKIVHEYVYLLSIYDKSEKESISDKELDKMLKTAGLY